MRERHPDTLVYSSEDGSVTDRRGRGFGASGRATPESVPRASGAMDRTRSHSRASVQTSAARQRDGAPADSVVRIWLERHGRNGKPVSIVRGLRLDAAALAALAAQLKRACGTGGTAKEGEIVIQGDHRARIAAELDQHGLRVKLAGG